MEEDDYKSYKDEELIDRVGKLVCDKIKKKTYDETGLVRRRENLEMVEVEQG
jgi:hypothetical protein